MDDLPDPSSLPPAFREIFSAIRELSNTQRATAGSLAPLGDLLVDLSKPNLAIGKGLKDSVAILTDMDTNLMSVNASLQQVNLSLQAILSVLSNPPTSSMLVL
jgi:hypothetical protein